MLCIQVNLLIIAARKLKVTTITSCTKLRTRDTPPCLALVPPGDWCCGEAVGGAGVVWCHYPQIIPTLRGEEVS